jgi:hypothetical protein
LAPIVFLSYMDLKNSTRFNLKIKRFGQIRHVQSSETPGMVSVFESFILPGWTKRCSRPSKCQNLISPIILPAAVESAFE